MGERLPFSSGLVSDLEKVAEILESVESKPTELFGPPFSTEDVDALKRLIEDFSQQQKVGSLLTVAADVRGQDFAAMAKRVKTTKSLVRWLVNLKKAGSPKEDNPDLDLLRRVNQGLGEVADELKGMHQTKRPGKISIQIPGGPGGRWRKG